MTKRRRRGPVLTEQLGDNRLRKIVQARKIQHDLDKCDTLDVARWEIKLDRVMRQAMQERDDVVKHGKVSWDVGQFKGHFHKKRIKSKYPIPGTQISIDEENETVKILRNIRLEGTIDEMEEEFKKSGKRRGRVHVELEAIRANLGHRHNTIQKLRGVMDAQTNETKDILLRHGRESNALANQAQTSEKLLQEVLGALNEHNFDFLELIFKRRVLGPNMTCPPYSNTLLMEAARKLRVTMVKFLLFCGADPNQKNSLGETALHVVWQQLSDSLKGNDDTIIKLDELNTQSIVELLLNANAHVNCVNIRSETALHYAVRCSSPRICFVLLQAGVDPNISDVDRRKPQDMLQAHGESRRMLANWNALRQAGKLAEFKTKWTAKLLGTQHPSNMLIHKPVLQVLQETELQQWSRHAAAHVRRSILVKAAGPKEQISASSSTNKNNNKNSGSTVGQNQKENGSAKEIEGNEYKDYSTERGDEEDGNKKSRGAAAGAVAAFGSKLQNSENTAASADGKVRVGDLDKLVPRAIAEHVRRAQLRFTSRFRRQVRAKRNKLRPSAREPSLVEYLVGSEERQRADHKDAQKKKEESMKLLNRKIRTVKNLMTDHFKGSATEHTTKHFARDFTTRPSTVSALGRSGSTCRPAVLQAVANVGTRLQNTASANTSGKGRSSVDAEERTRTGAKLAAMSLAQVVHSRQRDTLLPGDIDRDLQRLAATLESEKRAKTAVDEKSRFENTRTRRRGNIDMSKMGTVRSQLKKMSTKEEINSDEASSAKAELRNKYKLNSPRVLPPNSNLQHVLSTSKRSKKATKQWYNRNDILVAFSQVQAAPWARSGLIPAGLSAAVIDHVVLNDGQITEVMLIENFKEYRAGKDYVDAKPAIQAVVEQLHANHKYESLHPDVVSFGDGVAQPKPSFVEMRARPFQEPWSHAKLGTDNSANIKNPDSNPYNVAIRSKMSAMQSLVKMGMIPKAVPKAYVD